MLFVGLKFLTVAECFVDQSVEDPELEKRQDDGDENLQCLGDAKLNFFIRVKSQQPAPINGNENAYQKNVDDQQDRRHAADNQQVRTADGGFLAVSFFAFQHGKITFTNRVMIYFARQSRPVQLQTGKSADYVRCCGRKLTTVAIAVCDLTQKFNDYLTPCD